VNKESEAMKNLCVHICAGLLIAATNNAALAQAQPAPQAPAGSAVLVTVDNFRRAESDLVMGPIVKDGGFGKYVHHRELYPVDAPIVRPNRDTLYSFSNYSQVRLRLTAFGIAVRERSYINSLIAGGEGGIRTYGTVTRTTVFETAPSHMGIGGRVNSRWLQALATNLQTCFRNSRPVRS
jgi:hypothetical protein